MKSLLSHAKTWKELADYLAQNTIEVEVHNGRRVVVAWRSEYKGTRNFSYLQSNHEEADTKTILHAVDATSRGATDLRIHSPTRMSSSWFSDVIQAYTRTPCSSQAELGRNHREIQLHPIYRSLGRERVTALLAFRALSGTDNTGCFSVKGKTTCWSWKLTMKSPMVFLS